MKLASKTVSPVVRDLVRRRYPGLERDPAYWRMVDGCVTYMVG